MEFSTGPTGRAPRPKGVRALGPKGHAIIKRIGGGKVAPFPNPKPGAKVPVKPFPNPKPGMKVPVKNL